jgi:protein SCO1/2
VLLTDQNNETVDMSSFTKSKCPVLLNFFYTRCKTTCPVLASDFANFQYRLKADSSRVHLISITIDPEHDSVDALARFQKRYKAKPGWIFLTGNQENVQLIMHVFAAYTKYKMGYYPLVYLYEPKKKQWIQFEGYVTVEKLIEEYEKVIN